MKQNVLAIALTLALAAALGLALWWDARLAQNEIRPQRDEPVSATLGSMPAPVAPERSVQRSSLPHGAMARCELDGRVSYQSAPCAVGARQKGIEGGTFTVVSPPPVAVGRTPVEHTQGGTVGFIARTPSAGKVNAGRCEHLKRRIAVIDEQARQGQSSSSQRRIQEERLKVRNEMWELKCGS